jgi:hypothetical protein
MTTTYEKKRERTGAAVLSRKTHEASAARFRLQRERWEERSAKVEPVNLQLLELLLGLLRETRSRAGRGAGKQPFDEDARHHAER